MRRTSKTNSRKHKSADTVAEYCQRFDYDEPLYWLGIRITRNGPKEEQPRIVDQGDWRNRLELNHIWSMGARPDYRSNFCRQLKEGHDWFHANLSAGRVVCVLTKLVKREAIGEREEFDLDEINAAAGKFVSGVIANYRFVDPLLRRLNDDCLVRLKALEMERA